MVQQRTDLLGRVNNRQPTTTTYLLPLLTTQLERLASLDGLLRLVLALDTLHAQDNLLRGLGLPSAKLCAVAGRGNARVWKWKSWVTNGGGGGWQ